MAEAKNNFIHRVEGEKANDSFFVIHVAFLCTL
jgi:hypothetical protein